MIQIKPDDTLVEIGPGRGALTKDLIKLSPNMHAIELDRDLIDFLHYTFPSLQLTQADALDFDFKQLADKQQIKVVGNLPYNVSTPILFHLLEASSCIQTMHFMLQKEVVDRICAKPGTKQYGRLSIMIQYQCSTESLFDVPDTAFDPPPKVQSAVVRIIPYQSGQNPYPQTDIEQLRKVVTSAFSMRRKTMRNALKTMISAQELEALDIDPGARPETISVDQFVSITNKLNN